MEREETERLQARRMPLRQMVVRYPVLATGAVAALLGALVVGVALQKWFLVAAVLIAVLTHATARLILRFEGQRRQRG